MLPTRSFRGPWLLKQLCKHPVIRSQYCFFQKTVMILVNGWITVEADRGCFRQFGAKCEKSRRRWPKVEIMVRSADTAWRVARGINRGDVEGFRGGVRWMQTRKPIGQITSFRGKSVIWSRISAANVIKLSSRLCFLIKETINILKCFRRPLFPARLARVIPHGHEHRFVIAIITSCSSTTTSRT